MKTKRSVEEILDQFGPSPFQQAIIDMGRSRLKGTKYNVPDELVNQETVAGLVNSVARNGEHQATLIALLKAIIEKGARQ